MGPSDADSDLSEMTVTDRTVRIRNYSYALARLCAFSGALTAFGIISFLVIRGGGQWSDVVLSYSVVTPLVVWTAVIALRAAWWVDIAAWGMRVRYLVGHRDFPWREISNLRLRHETTYVDQGLVDIPLWRYRVLELEPIGSSRVVIVLNRREVPMAQRILDEFRRRRNRIAGRVKTGQHRPG